MKNPFKPISVNRICIDCIEGDECIIQIILYKIYNLIFRKFYNELFTVTTEYKHRHE